MVRPVIVSLVILYILLLGETMFFSNVEILGFNVIPDLVLLAVIYLALQNGSLFGEIIGFGSGLLVDFIGGGPFGLNCLVRTIFGFGFGFFRRTLNSDMFLVRLGVGLAATLLKALLVLLIQLLFPVNEINGYAILSPAFRIEAAANTICCPVLFLLLSLCKPILTVKDRE